MDTYPTFGEAAGAAMAHNARMAADTERPAALDALLDAVADQLPPDDPETCAQTLAGMTTPSDRTALRNLIGDALVAAGGVPGTFPVVVNAQAGVLADAVLTALPDLLAAHARQLAGEIDAAITAHRAHTPGPGPHGHSHHYRGGMIRARQILDRYADQFAAGGDR